MPLPRNRRALVGHTSPDMVPWQVRVRRRILVATEQFLGRMEALGLDFDQRCAAVRYAEQVAMQSTRRFTDVLDEIAAHVASTGVLPFTVEEAA